MPECMTPFTVRKKLTNESVPVPCGKCPACYRRRVSGWSFRLMQEDRVALSSFFVTLTYDTKHVPITDFGYMSISKRDVQLFMKRLRKLNNNKLKYYAVGEYGGKTNRPHYHVILFNATEQSVQAAWNLGQVHYGSVSGASVGYTLKYMSKVKKIPMHKNDDRVSEFGLMSKGLGLNYLSDAMVNWHKASMYDRMYVNVDGNKKVSMPRYYKNKIYSEAERKAVGNVVRSKMLEDKYKLEDSDLMYSRNEFFSHLQAFKKMAADSIRNNKI